MYSPFRYNTHFIYLSHDANPLSEPIIRQTIYVLVDHNNLSRMCNIYTVIQSYYVINYHK